MQKLKSIVLTCKDITPTIFTNYAMLLNKQENMLNEIQFAKKELLSLGFDVDDENNSNQGSFWPYMDSEAEKQHNKIKIAQLKLSKCEFDYELLKTETSEKFYEFQKVNSRLMEMLVYVIQEIAYNEEKEALKKNNKNITNTTNTTRNEDMLYESEEEPCEFEDSETVLNPDFPKTKKKTILFMITRIEPFIIDVLSILLLINYSPEMSIISIL